jgi:Tfp pilus assembly protein PilF
MCNRLLVILVFCAALPSSGWAGCIDRYPADQCPAYGGVEKSSAQKAADRELIAAVEAAGFTRQQGADRAVARAWQAMRRGDMAAAARRFNQAWLLAPESGLAEWGFAAISQVRDQDSALAESLFLEAVKKMPLSADLHVDIGRFYGRTDRPADAFRFFEKALEIDGNVRDAYKNMTIASLDLGRYEDACRYGRKAAKRGENIPPRLFDLLEQRFSVTCPAE